MRKRLSIAATLATVATLGTVARLAPGMDGVVALTRAPRCPLLTKAAVRG
jgi:hypothetical protein